VQDAAANTGAMGQDPYFFCRSSALAEFVLYFISSMLGTHLAQNLIQVSHCHELYYSAMPRNMVSQVVSLQWHEIRQDAKGDAFAQCRARSCHLPRISYELFTKWVTLNVQFCYDKSWHLGRKFEHFRILTRTWHAAAGGVSIPAYWAPASLIRPTPKKTPVA